MTGEADVTDVVREHKAMIDHLTLPTVLGSLLSLVATAGRIQIALEKLPDLAQKLLDVVDDPVKFQKRLAKLRALLTQLQVEFQEIADLAGSALNPQAPTPA